MFIKKEKIFRILCIKPRGIGDVVLSTIVLDNLKNYFKQATIHYLIESFVKPALENIPQIDEILTINKNDSLFSIVFKIRKEKYDLIFDFWSNPRTAQITFLSGAKYRVGFSYRGRRFAYNIKGTSGRGDHHSAEHNLELLNALDIPIVSKKIHFNITQKENSEAEKFIKSNLPTEKNIIGIIPSGSWESKRCEPEKWVEICRALLEKYDTRFLILWGPGDEDDANYIKNNLPQNIVSAPRTKLREMASLINNCDLIIANDSGPMHIAAALNIPTIGLFGPTDPKGHAPYSKNSGFVIREDLHCIKCNLLKCPYQHECMTQLRVSDVINKVEQIVGMNLKSKN